MPFPSDRKGLLLLAEKTTGLLASMEPPATPDESRRYALELTRLGEVRLRLGEFQEAERLFEEAVALYDRLGSVHDEELAAAARFWQVRSATMDGRTLQALEMIDRMIERDPELSMLRWIPRIWASAIQFRPILLEQLGGDARLYEASGMALDLLHAAGPTIPLALGRTLFLRAKSAEHLGHKEEAVTHYERAIAELEGDGPSAARDELLNQAMLGVAVVLRELDRADEASNAMLRLQQSRGKSPFSRAMRTLGRLWARTVD